MSIVAILTACGGDMSSVPTPARPATLAPTTPTAVQVAAGPTSAPSTAGGAAAPASTPATAPAPTSTPVPRLPPTPPVVLSTPEVRDAGSRVEEREFPTPALGQNMTYLVYLPPGYDTSTRRYPTVYLLHGVAGDATEWPSIGIPEAADRLLEQGAIQPMIVVFPYGDAGFYVNNANDGLRWSDYFVQDVVASVDATYRTLGRKESRAVGGLSMGGDAALQLAIRFPDVFGIAGAHSPSSRLLFEHVNSDVYGSEEFFRDHNAFWLAQKPIGPITARLWIDVGDEDPWRWNASAIHFALAARGVPHDFTMWPGMHDGDYWVAHTDDYLGYYSRALLGP